MSHWYYFLVKLIETIVVVSVCELKENMERVPCGDERGLCDDDQVQRCDYGSGGKTVFIYSVCFYYLRYDTY